MSVSICPVSIHESARLESNKQTGSNQRRKRSKAKKKNKKKKRRRRKEVCKQVIEILPLLFAPYV